MAHTHVEYCLKFLQRLLWLEKHSIIIIYHETLFTACFKGCTWTPKEPRRCPWPWIGHIALREFLKFYYRQELSHTSQMRENSRTNLQVPITAAAAAAKSLRSCPTLCDPIDGSPLGSPVPGIFQARVLEWGAIAFSIMDSTQFQIRFNKSVVFFF